MKVLVLVFVTVFFFGCGVETNSSGNITDSDSSIIDDGTGTDTNDSNTTDSTDGTDGVTVIDDSSDSGFNQTDAELDSNACIINSTYKVIDDSSFDPLASSDLANGLELASQYNFSSDLEATKVALFYPELTVTKLDKNVHLYEENYRLSFDKAWTSNNLARVYIRTPLDVYGAYSCYRYDLDSLSGDSITKTKVYR